MSDPQLQTLLEDVRTIKAILQNEDAPLPRVWRAIYFVVVPALVLVAGLKVAVPALTALDFLSTLLWLWVPVLSASGVIIAVLVRGDLRKTGTRFLAQGRVRAFFYSRLIIVPAVLVLAWLLSLNSAYSMDGAMLVLVSVGISHVVLLVPGRFQAIPVLYLAGGLAELALGLQGPWWTFFNTLAVAAGLARAALLLQQHQGSLPEEAHE